MRMSAVVAALALVSVAGCKKKKQPAGPGSGTAAGSAAHSGKPVKLDKPTADEAKQIAAGKNQPAAPQADQAKSEQDDKGDLKVVYAEGDSEVRQALRDEKLFEKVVGDLNGFLKLPRDIPVILDKCNEINAFYDAEKVAITMCDELVEHFSEVFTPGRSEDEAADAVIGSTYFFFLHELGHALINQLDLPAVGREEDAVDQMATVLLIAGGDQGEAIALTGAESFLALSDAEGGDQTPYWDEHSLNEQRFYNIICLIYGSNPEKYEELVKSGTLPEERAEQCPAEYEAISKSWDKLLGPYVK